MRTEIIMAGSGGQGVQFAGQNLARAALAQGLKATYVPSYSAERRGGPSFCSVVVADRPIYTPVFTRPDVLLAFDRRGRNQYADQVKPGGLIVSNQDLAPDAAPGESAPVLSVPASTLAEGLGRRDAMNLVLLGAYLARSGLVALERSRDTLRESAGRKKPELLEGNLEALARGAAFAAQEAKT